MNSREIVKRCIEFKNPPRIAGHFRVDPIDGFTIDESDFAAVGCKVDPKFIRQPGQNEWTTEWGVKKKAITTKIGTAVGYPLGDGWHQLDSYQPPDLFVKWRWTNFKENVAKSHADGKYIYGSIPSLMLLPIDLRGMENWYMDQALEKDNLSRLLEMILDIRKKMIKYYAEAGVDGVITYDDMGTQDVPLVSPDTFRELYFNPYKQTIDLLHEHGMHFIHHCCGQVNKYMDMFIEAGCDVIQLDQPELMGVEWLGKNYGGKICFWNCVDIQKTIGSGDLDVIEEEAHKQVWNLGNFEGGFMVKSYQQPESIGMTIEQAKRQYQAFKKYGNYPLKPYIQN